MHLGRQVVEEEVEGIVDAAFSDQVIVVEDEAEGLRALANLVEQAGQLGLCRRRTGPGHIAHVVEAGERPQGGDDVGPEASGVIVVRFQ